MWSWVLHRITGVATFFFLFVHVLDTALVRVNPETYDAVIETYKNPIVGLMELGLVAWCSTTPERLARHARRLLVQGPEVPARDALDDPGDLVRGDDPLDHSHLLQHVCGALT